MSRFLDTSRSGYYIIPPEAAILSECQFYSCESEIALTQLQGLVGGFIEPVGLPIPGVQAYVDEEGKWMGKPYNPLATGLYGRDDQIVGTMVILCGNARLT